MEEENFLEFIAAYENWWSASEIYRDLTERVAKGDGEAAEYLKIVIPILTSLEQDYLDKKRHLDHASMSKNRINE